MRTMYVILIMAAIALLSGCQEERKQGKWGEGDPPAKFQNIFGNENNARLNFIQSQAISELATRVRTLEAENPAELAKRVQKLEVEVAYKYHKDKEGDASADIVIYPNPVFIDPNVTFDPNG